MSRPSIPDNLYELCVDGPRRNHAVPIRVDYGDGAEDPPVQTGRPVVEVALETGNLIRALLQLEQSDFPDFPSPTPLPFHWQAANRWVLGLNSDYPGMFTDFPRRIDAFPLWSTFDE